MLLSSTVRCNSMALQGQSTIGIYEGRPPSFPRLKGGLLLFDVGKQGNDEHSEHEHQY
jgi:hypothetical protein